MYNDLLIASDTCETSNNGVAQASSVRVINVCSTRLLLQKLLSFIFAPKENLQDLIRSDFSFIYHNDSFIEFPGASVVIHQLDLRHIDAVIRRL